MKEHSQGKQFTIATCNNRHEYSSGKLQMHQMIEYKKNNQIFIKMLFR